MKHTKGGTTGRSKPAVGSERVLVNDEASERRKLRTIDILQAGKARTEHAHVVLYESLPSTAHVCTLDIRRTRYQNVSRAEHVHRHANTTSSCFARAKRRHVLNRVAHTGRNINLEASSGLSDIDSLVRVTYSFAQET